MSSDGEDGEVEQRLGLDALPEQHAVGEYELGQAYTAPRAHTAGLVVETLRADDVVLRVFFKGGGHAADHRAVEGEGIVMTNSLWEDRVVPASPAEVGYALCQGEWYEWVRPSESRLSGAVEPTVPAADREGGR